MAKGDWHAVRSHVDRPNKRQNMPNRRKLIETPRMSETVNFTAMKDGSREEYEMLEALEEVHRAGTADRLLREEVTWVVEHHGIFQMYYYAHHYGWDRELRAQYKDSPFYQSCIYFCEHWDQSSFDPEYPTDPLESFAELVHEVFSRKAFDPAHIQPGKVIGVQA